MKRIFNHLSAMAAIAALVVSCNKEKDYAGKEEVSGDKLRFEATAAEVKTTIENGSGNERIVKWAAGDEITIYFDDSSVEAAAIEAGTSTTFEATASASAENYYAVYPKDAASGLTTGDPDVLNVAVPAAQDGAFANANIAVAKTTAAAKSFAFKNATALVKFSVGDGYTKAVFTGNKGESLAGTVPVTFGSADITLGEVVNPAKKIEVTLNGAGEYYFAVLPQTFESGFSITLYKGDVADTPKAVHASRTLARATILNLGRVDEVDSITDYFVTPTGSGSGKSWDKAMGPAQLKALLETSSDSDVSNAKAALLDGVTIHMAAGDYYLAGEAGAVVEVGFASYSIPVRITFKGGYPATLTGTNTTAARDTSVTAFTGNTEAKILHITDNANITFDGITFKDSNTTDSEHAAIGINSSSATVTVQHCTFKNNKNSDAGQTGAAMTLVDGTLTLSNCTFTGNTARNAGALFLKDDGSLPVGVSYCKFDSNTSTNTSGAVQNAKHTNVTFSHCVFKNNEAKSYGGGAFHCSTGSVTLFEDCSFSKNSSSANGNGNGGGGAISLEYTADVTCTRCGFVNNTANLGDKLKTGDSNVVLYTVDEDGIEKKYSNIAGGAILLRHAECKITLNSCKFSQNSAPYGCGGAIGSQKEGSTITINNGTTFENNQSYLAGGAICASGNVIINGTSASKVSFSNCKTLATASASANGGAIWLGGSTSTITMNNAEFNNCEAGQEDGSTVYYSNGGAICIKTVASFTANNCEFTACRGRNGAALNLEPGSSGKVEFSDCDFHDNINRSGLSKDGTAGYFSGGAARLGFGAAKFENCKFSNNVTYNASGVFHINDKNSNLTCISCTFTGNSVVNTGNFRGGVFGVEHGRATFEDCMFKDNKVNGRGSIGAVQNNSMLRMNRCLVKNNSSATGGTINVSNDCLVYLNEVTFKDNITTQATNSWGVAIHSANSIVCMNNVTGYNNHNTGGATSNSASFNSDGGWLITNSTIMDNTPTAIVRRGGNSRKVIVCNSILINRHTANNVFTLNNTTNVANNGHNLLSCDSYNIPAATDLLSQSDASLGGVYSEVWSTSNKYGIYSWSNALSGFTAATEQDVINAIKSYSESFTPESGSNVNSSITNIGQDFYNWLDSLDPKGYLVDARGVTRGTPWWPGAYQAN